MNTLATAYLVAWVAVAAYLGWLGAQHRRLSRRLDKVEMQSDDAGRGRTRAA